MVLDVNLPAFKHVDVGALVLEAPLAFGILLGGWFAFLRTAHDVEKYGPVAVGTALSVLFGLTGLRFLQPICSVFFWLNTSKSLVMRSSANATMSLWMRLSAVWARCLRIWKGSRKGRYPSRI